MRLCNPLGLVCLGILGTFHPAVGNGQGIYVDSQVVTRNAKGLKFPLLDWLFGVPEPPQNNAVPGIKNGTNVTTTEAPFPGILPVEEIPVKNSTYRRFVLKKEVQDQINDEIYLHNHPTEKSGDRNTSNVVESNDANLNTTSSTSTTLATISSTPKSEGGQRKARQLFGGGGPDYHHSSVFDPYRRGNWHQHHGHHRRRKHHRAAPQNDHAGSGVPLHSDLMKRQGIFPMTLTPQQQMYIQQAAMLQRQQQQLLALSGLSDLMGNSALMNYLRNNNNDNINKNGNEQHDHDRDRVSTDRVKGDGNGTRKRRRPSSYDDYEDSEEDYYYDDDDGDAYSDGEGDGDSRDDGSEFDSEELVRDFLTPEDRAF